MINSVIFLEYLLLRGFLLSFRKIFNLGKRLTSKASIIHGDEYNEPAFLKHGKCYTLMTLP